MRNKYIDNLRIFCILLLFPFHTCMIYNNWGEIFYVTGTPLKSASIFVAAVYPWWMTLLFTIAGISTFYALKKRTMKQYVKERVHKLLIPLLVGLLIIIPVQSYIAYIFYNGYAGSYFEHYKIFFTRFTYLTGQDGGFTPGHLWFLLYLFIVSLVMVPIIKWYEGKSRKLNFEKLTVGKLLPLFVVILLFTPILEIAGKSIGEALACFGIGYFILSNEVILERLERKCWLLVTLFVLTVAIRLIMSATGNGQGIIWDIEQRMVTWFGILAFLAIGKKYLNYSNKVTDYFSKAAFPLYYFHQSILVIIGYFTLKYITFVPLQFIVIMVFSFVGSIFCYEVSRRFRVTCFLFGIKAKPKVDCK